MAKISTIKEAILLCRAAGITAQLWGHRGLGKSSAVQQLAGSNGWGMIDYRCSQLEPSDIRGLPDRGSDGRTHYLPPSDMPIGDLSHDEIGALLAESISMPYKSYAEFSTQIVDRLVNANQNDTRKYYQRLQELQPRFQNGILFLDEVNRAQDDVLQALFQLVLDRKIGQYVLPPGWSIVTAGNYMEGYQVSGFSDPAFLNRFCHLDVAGGETTLEEWVNYISMVHGQDATDVVEFASMNIKHLDGDVQGERGFSVQPSRRSWEMIVKVQKACQKQQFSQAAINEVYAGLVGRELALTFSRYSCPVKPRDLINDGVAAHSKKLRGLPRNATTGLMWGLVSFCKHQINDEKIAKVCLDFAEEMLRFAEDKDVVVAFCRALVSGEKGNDQQEKARAAVISNPRLATMIAKFNKRNGNETKTFIDWLASRPQLQDVLSKTSWGISSEGDD